MSLQQFVRRMLGVGADGKRWGTTTSNPDGSVLLASLSGSNAANGQAVPATAVYIGGLAGDGTHINVPNVLSGPIADGFSDSYSQLLNIAMQRGWNGSTWDRVRVGSGKMNGAINATATAALSATVLWTPAAGKRFRLLAAALSVASGAATAGFLRLYDNTTGFAIGADVQYPTSGIALVSMPLPENGYLSLAANNALGVYNSTACTLSAAVFGVEE